MNNDIVSEVKLGGRTSGDPVAVALMGSITGSVDRINKVAARLTADYLEERAGEYRAAYIDALATDEWLLEFPGRDILKAFVATNLGDVKYETFRNVVVDHMQRSETQPAGVKAVLDQILAS